MTLLSPLKLCGLTAIVFGLAACSTTPKQDILTDAPAAPQGPAIDDGAEQVIQAPVPTQQADSQGPVISAPLPASGPTPGSIDDFIGNVGDRVFFGYNQYTLTTQARDVLRNQSQWLNNYPGAIAVIGGHADERGTREYNLALGARRADAVKAFLVTQGVDPSRVTTVSYGKERPIDGASNEQAWSLNRNGHTVIVSGAPS